MPLLSLKNFLLCAVLHKLFVSKTLFVYIVVKCLDSMRLLSCLSYRCLSLLDDPYLSVQP
jgi:hypothetical protein